MIIHIGNSEVIHVKGGECFFQIVQSIKLISIGVRFKSIYCPAKHKKWSR